MKIELRPALTVGFDPASTPRPTGIPEDFAIFANDANHGYLYLTPDGYCMGLFLPGHGIEYGPVFLPTKEHALAQAKKIIPLLIGAPLPQEEEE